MQVCAAIIIKNGSVLIAQRPAHKSHPLEWEFPGGKIEPFETHEDCLKREILEEIGLEIELISLFHETEHHYSTHNVTLYFYICKALKSEFNTDLGLEGQSLKWVNFTNLEKEKMLDGDAFVVQKLINSNLKY